MGKKKRKHPAAEGSAAAAAAPATCQPGTAAPPPQKQRRPSHQHTDAAPTGLGQQLSAAPGRLAREALPPLSSSQPAAKWAPPAAAPSSCPHNPAAAVELELARATALEQLRRRFASLVAKAGLRNAPLLAFERWRFASKWAEDEPQLAAAAAAGGTAPQQPQQSSRKQQQPGKQKQKQQAGDPVIPFGSLAVAAEPGLVSDLTRAGVDVDAAVDAATQLAGAAAAAAAAVVRKRQQLASGKAISCGDVQVEFHKHSLDLMCDGMFVKISRPAYGKLARLYRQHWLDRTGAGAGAAAAAGAAAQACSVGLPPADAATLLTTLQDTCPAAAAEEAAGHKAKKRKASAAATPASSSSDGDSSSDSDSDADEQAAGGGITAAADAGRDTDRHEPPLDVEARIAELEQAAAAAAAGSSGGSSGGRPRADFHARLFALLLRHKSIQGHGFQAAAGPSVFELLRSRLSVGYECFASPLNAHFSRFGSAFPDVDAPFGSSGSFFRMQLKHGSYEVNPPFVPAILTAAAHHMLQLLQAAEVAGGALAFVVLMPGWQEVSGWQLLNSSSFKRQTLLLAAADHGYCDGASHQRKDLYRQSPYDSSVTFLQTTAAAKKWPVSQQVLTDLQVAFAACCPSAAAAGRQKKRRGARDLEAKGYGVPVQSVKQTATAAGGGGGGGAAAVGKAHTVKK